MAGLEALGGYGSSSDDSDGGEDVSKKVSLQPQNASSDDVDREHEKRLHLKVFISRPLTLQSQ